MSIPDSPLQGGANVGKPSRTILRWEKLFLAVVLVAIGWFYLWTAYTDERVTVLSPSSNHYYALLTSGFMKGHLYMDVVADPYLATLKDPSDPAQANGHGMHDVSYYKGHYYLYFGVTPVITTFLPVRLLTGEQIEPTFAGVAYCWIGLLASVWIFLEIKKRYFPATGVWVVVVGTTALGLCNLVPLLLRRFSVWELPIACAYACLMSGFSVSVSIAT